MLTFRNRSCRRLGLLSLSYLWQRDQTQLLEEMHEARLESLLIKVAGAGLQATDLGRSITEPGMIEKLHRLVRHPAFCLRQISSSFARQHERFGLHVCGEGGEFETFTTDCALYRSRIVL